EMIHLRHSTPWTRTMLPLILTSVAIGGCATLRADQTTQTEQILSASGFVMRPADTPESRAELPTLTPRKVVRHVRDGQAQYVYADPETCKCLYVGNEQQYQKYQDLSLQKKIADEELAAAEGNRAADQWGGGGPW